MSAREKKHRERHIVEAFLRNGGESLPNLKEWDRERPDAIVTLNGETVGLEVTALIEAVPRQKVSPQKWTEEAERVVVAAQRTFENHNATPVVVRFGFRPDWQPNGRRRSVLADRLAELVEQVVQRVSLVKQVGKPFTANDPLPEVSWLYVAAVRPEVGSHWGPSFAFTVESASAADVRATLAKKEVDVAAYRLVTPKIWLLINCDLSGQGVALEPPDPQFSVSTSFDRVFCTGFGYWQWVEILKHECTRNQ
jgi:hypothetical protein